MDGRTGTQYLNGISTSLAYTDLLSDMPCTNYTRSTSINIRGSNLDLCVCKHTWLKTSVESGMLALTVTDVTCPGFGRSWRNSPSEDLALLCSRATIGSGCPESKFLSVFYLFIRMGLDFNLECHALHI